jgi:hypothetical protein
VLPDAPWQNDYYGIGLAATDDYLKANPDVITAISEGIAKTAVLLKRNPEKIIGAFWTTNRTRAPLPGEDETSALGKERILLRVKAYIALPYVFAALEVSVVLAMTAAVVAEMLGSGTTIGLGTMIRLYESHLNAAGIFANLIALSLLGVLLHALVASARKKLLSW